RVVSSTYFLYRVLAFFQSLCPSILRFFLYSSLSSRLFYLLNALQALLAPARNSAAFCNYSSLAQSLGLAFLHSSSSAFLIASCSQSNIPSSSTLSHLEFSTLSAIAPHSASLIRYLLLAFCLRAAPISWILIGI